MRWIACGLIGVFFMNAAIAGNFVVTSNSFVDGGTVPVQYTCDGKDVSPELSWSNPPKNTQSLVLIVSDPDAPGGIFYHWVVYNIPASAKELLENSQNLPQGTSVGKNSWDKNQYNGPCPPRGTAHTYDFTLYALNAPVKIPAGADGITVLDSIKDHVIKKVQITTVYSRWLK